MKSIENIEIKNFKSIRHQKIDDCKRVNVFVGYPNTGKSNILEALGLYSVYLNASQNFQFNEICRVRRFSELFYNKDTRSGVEVSINHKVQLNAEINPAGELWLGAKRVENDQLNVAFVHSSDFGIYAKDLVYGSVEQVNSYISPDLAPIRKYEFVTPGTMDKRTPAMLDMPYGRNLLEVLHGNAELRKEVAALFEIYDQKLVLDDEEMLFLKYLPDGTGVSIPYHLVADTLRRLIFYKAAMLSNRQSVLLFEEPEAHMFPPYISKFTADVMYDKNDNQFFINTHSPFVVNELMENLKSDELSIYAVGYKKEKGETVIRKLAEKEVNEIYQTGMDLFLNLENYLDHEHQ